MHSPGLPSLPLLDVCPPVLPFQQVEDVYEQPSVTERVPLAELEPPLPKSRQEQLGNPVREL